MVRARTPEDENRRRIRRVRKVLIMERVQYVNRIKGLLFSQGASGYEPLRRDRRARLDALQTGMAVAYNRANAQGFETCLWAMFSGTTLPHPLVRCR
jgi:transposase